MCWRTIDRGQGETITKRQKDRQTDTERENVLISVDFVYRHFYSLIKRDRRTKTEIERQRDKQRDRQRDIKRNREKD